MNLTDQLIRDEGLRLYPYKDTVGKITIGVGRNLSDVGISAAEAQTLLANDIERATESLEKEFPWVCGLNQVRHAAFVNLTFNMGVGALAKFPKFLAAARAGDWCVAHDELINSEYARQVGARAERIALQLQTGAWQ